MNRHCALPVTVLDVSLVQKVPTDPPSQSIPSSHRLFRTCVNIFTRTLAGGGWGWGLGVSFR